MRKVNYLLLIGTFVLLFLMAVSMFPEQFTKVDPYGKQFEKLSYEGGKFSGATPPIAPCKEFPWGTDTLGRDMKSLIIYGCKATLAIALSIALGRLLIALPLSIMAAYKNRFAMVFIKEFNIVFSAFPLVILVVFFARSNITEQLVVNNMLPVAIMLTAFGWGKLANIITQKVKEILSQDFIEGEVSIGKNKLEIAVQNILPHLIPNLIVMVFLEVALILTTLAQIGILTTVFSQLGFFDIEGNMNTPLEFDWPSLFIFSYYLFGSDKTWLIVYPALAFAVSIIGFNLFGEGLRLEFDKKNSKIISFIKRIPTILSPVRFVYQMRHFNDYRSTVIRKSIAIVLVLAIIAIPKPNNMFELNTQSAFSQIGELNKFENEEIKGSDFELKYADIIVKKLEALSVHPFDERYIHEFKAEKRQLTDSSININFDNKSINLIYNEDYWIRECVPGDNTYNMEIFKVDQINSIRNVSKERLAELRGKVIAIDYRGADFKKAANAFMFIQYDIRPRGLVVIYPENAMITKAEPKLDSLGTNVILVKSGKLDQLSGISKAKISIKVQDGLKEGINVIGYIPGCDEKLKNEYIVIGSPINYLQNSTSEYRTSEVGGAALALEIAEAIQKYGVKPKRSIVFAFWGGDKSLGRGTIDFVKKYFEGTENTALYIDLKDLTNMQTNDLLVDTSHIMPKSKIGQEYIKILKKYADINNVKLNYGSIESPYAKDFYDTNRQAMVISSSRKGPIFDKLYKDNNQMNQEKFSKAAQMVFNTVVEMALMGEE